MTKVITLSTGDTVHLRERWTRGDEKAYVLSLKNGVTYKNDLETGQLVPMEEIPAANFDMAYDAVLPRLVEKFVSPSGVEYAMQEFKPDDLLQADYELIEAEVIAIRRKSREQEKKSN